MVVNDGDGWREMAIQIRTVFRIIWGNCRGRWEKWFALWIVIHVGHSTPTLRIRHADLVQQQQRVARFSLSRQAMVYGSHGPNHHRTTQPMRLVTEQERLIEFVPFRWRSDRISSATERGHEMQTAEQPPRLSFVSPKWRSIKVIIIILKVASRFPVYRLRRWKWSNFIVKLNGIFVGWGNLVIFHGIYSLLLCDSPELSILLTTIDRGNGMNVLINHNKDHMTEYCDCVPRYNLHRYNKIIIPFEWKFIFGDNCLPLTIQYIQCGW